MPRNVRNFWLDGRIDGRTAVLSGGPGARSGGMRLVIYGRNKGSVEQAAVVDCEAMGDTLRVRIDGKQVWEGVR